MRTFIGILLFGLGCYFWMASTWTVYEPDQMYQVTRKRGSSRVLVMESGEVSRQFHAEAGRLYIFTVTDLGTIPPRIKFRSRPRPPPPGP